MCDVGLAFDLIIKTCSRAKALVLLNLSHKPSLKSKSSVKRLKALKGSKRQELFLPSGGDVASRSKKNGPTAEVGNQRVYFLIAVVSIYY